MMQFVKWETLSIKSFSNLFLNSCLRPLWYLWMIFNLNRRYSLTTRIGQPVINTHTKRQTDKIDPNDLCVWILIKWNDSDCFVSDCWRSAYMQQLEQWHQHKRFVRFMSAVLDQSTTTSKRLFVVYKTTLCLLSKCLMCLLALTPPGPQGHRVEVSNCVPVIVHLKGLYGLSSLHNCVHVDEMKWTQKPFLTRLICSQQIDQAWKFSRGTGLMPRFMTQLLILVQGWGRAVKKTFSSKKLLCVCVYVCVLGGGFMNCLPTLEGVALPLQASEITDRVIVHENLPDVSISLCSCRTNGEREGGGARERESKREFSLCFYTSD